MKAYWKDIFRTIKYEKKRFFCLMLITALGVTMFTGIRAACDDLTDTADAYYDELNLFDMNIASTLGLTEADVEALTQLEGVLEAEGGYELSVYTEVDDATQEAKARMIGKDMNRPYLVEGSLPIRADEIAVNSLYAKRSGKQVGDQIHLKEEVAEDQDPFLGVNDFTITAIISDPMDVNQSEGNMSWRSTTAVDYVFYLSGEAFDSDVFTYVYLTLEGAKELPTYSARYERLVGDMEDHILASVKEDREAARYEQVKEDAYREYYDAEEEVLIELADARTELEDGRKELEDGREDLADGKRELNKAEKELKDGKEQLAKGKQELADSEQLLNEQMEQVWEEIHSGKAQISEAKETLAASEAELAEGMQQLLKGKAVLAQQEEETLASLDAGFSQLNSELETATQAKVYLESQLAAFGGVIPPEGTPEYERYLALQNQLSQTEAGISYLESELVALEQTRETALQEFAKAKEELAAQEVLLNQGVAVLEEGKAELESSEQELLAGEQVLIQEEATAREQFAAAKEEIQKNEETIKDGLAQIKEARQELHEGEEELEEGWQELLEGEQEYLEGKEEAERELAEAKADIEAIEMAEWYVQTRSSLSGYANVDNDSGSIKGIGSFLSVIFFVVAILVSLTTITRMVEEDRGMIGTYKALGFTNGEIRRKALIYSASACLAGGIIGDIGGFIVLPKIIIVIFNTMYTFPDYTLGFDPLFGILGIAIFVAGVCLAVFVSCANILKEMPAILMRPQAPKSGSRIFLEYIPAIWSKMSFLNKVTARNLFRYKKRFFMTVFGIMGCTALLVCGFAIKNTVTDFMPKQYEHTYEYDIMAAAMPEDNEQLLSYMDDKEHIESYLNVQIESVKLKNSQGQEETVQLLVVPTGADLDPFIHLRLKDDSIIPLCENGVLITRNVCNILGFEKGDHILIRDIMLNEDHAYVSAIVENYLGNMIYMTESYYESHFKEFEANGVLVNLLDDCEDPIGYATDLGEKDGVISCVSNHSMRQDFSQAFALMNLVVYVVLVLAAGLAFVVLFTLATTNISERSRELATIKVLGFYDKEVHLYVNKETLLLSAIGIVVGLPAGVILTWALGRILNLPGIYFDISIFPSTYVLSAVIAFAFTIIVNQITNRLLDVIDPVEALKSVE